MLYIDFSLESLRSTFGLTLRSAELFSETAPLAAPEWLTDALARSLPLALGSEKARSEFIIAPILLALREINHDQIAIYSGQRLDADPATGLAGECDFLLATTP